MFAGFLIVSFVPVFEKQKIKKFQKGVDFFLGLSYNTKRATDEANKTKKNNKPSTFSSAGRAVDS